jgi:hypothetical protein
VDRGEVVRDVPVKDSAVEAKDSKVGKAEVKDLVVADSEVQCLHSNS